MTNMVGIASSSLPDEGVRIAEEAERRGIKLRLMGAVAIRICSPEFADLHQRLQRLAAENRKTEFSDIDLIGYGSQRSQIEDFFRSINYPAHPQARKLPVIWSDRHMYVNPEHGFNVDVFFDKLHMSHTLDLTGRLELDYPTIPPADLLLEKMQIVRINEKDIKDTIVLLRSHKLGDGGSRHDLNTGRISEVLSNDWGFWYTVTTNLSKMLSFAHAHPALSSTDKDDIAQKIANILEEIERRPKTTRFKLRARVGTKTKWYDDVDETFRSYSTEILLPKTKEFVLGVLSYPNSR